MVNYVGQLEPDYLRDNYKIVIRYDTDHSFLEHLIDAFKPDEFVELLARLEGSDENHDYLLRTSDSTFGVNKNAKDIFNPSRSFDLIALGDENAIYALKDCLAKNHRFEFLERKEHPRIEPLSGWGYAAFAAASLLLAMIAIFGNPAFEAELKGLPLAGFAIAISTVLITKYSLFWFFKNSAQTFPDPIKMNSLAFIYAVILFFMFWIFL